MDFKQELKNAIKEGKKVEQDRQDKINRAPKLTIQDKIRGIKGAFDRVKKQGIFNADTYCSKEEAIERVACCTTCTDGGTCPYCGCAIKAKRFLKTEMCPNPKTYSHLKKFPKRNFWSVCGESTTVILRIYNEEYLNDTLEQLFENATGKINVIVVAMSGMDITPKDERIRVVTPADEDMAYRTLINMTVSAIDGDYIFFTEDNIEIEQGWDTKLKCICDKGVIATPLITFPGDENKYVFMLFDGYMNWEVSEYGILPEKHQVSERSLCFHPSAWMIRTEDFLKGECFDGGLGHINNENVEWTLKNLAFGGSIQCRTDLCFKIKDNLQLSVTKSDNIVAERFIATLSAASRKNMDLMDYVNSFKGIYGEIPVLQSYNQLGRNYEVKSETVPTTARAMCDSCNRVTG